MSSKAGGRLSLGNELLHSDLGGATGYDSPIPLDSNVPYRWLLLYLLLANIWTLVLTALPVVTNVRPNNYYAHHPDWYTGDDVVRFIEPVGGLLINFFILYRSGIFNNGPLLGYDSACVGFFMFGAALYGQGSGFHSASAMYKSALDTLTKSNDDRFDSYYYYMHDLWQHIISHYIYAAGLAIMQASQAYAYRNITAPHLGLTRFGNVLLCCSGTIFALLILGVALQFPSGTIAAFIYLVLYGFGVIGGFHVYNYYHEKRTEVVQFGHLPVMHHFLLGYSLALVMLICWIIAVGGFKSRKEAGVEW